MQTTKRFRTAIRLPLLLVATSLLLFALGLCAGSEGWEWPSSSQQGLLDPLVTQIRAPRTIAAWAAGALLALAGAIAQGIFRNHLADPWLLGSASGAGLGIVIVLVVSIGAGAEALTDTGGDPLIGIDLVFMLAAFVGALAGVLMTVVLAGGASRDVHLLLAGVIVGIVLSAVSDLLVTRWPDALRGRQSFMLGSTAFVGWTGCALLAGCLALCLPLARRMSRLLDALILGEDTARSLGLPLSRLRVLLIAVFALCTAVAVSQAGLISFVGLVGPHLARRLAPSLHGRFLLNSSLCGGVLLCSADLLARTVTAPQEIPVGIVSALLGGSYLLLLLHRRAG